MELGLEENRILASGIPRGKISKVKSCLNEYAENLQIQTVQLKTQVSNFEVL